MAAGDVVAGISAVNASLQFTPAAGVEVMISQIGGGGNSARILNGANYTTLIGLTADSPIKLFLNNSFGLHIDAQGAGAYGGYSGIQIK